MTTAQDIRKLSYNDLRALAAAATELAEMKRVEEIKILADAYAKKAAAAGFSPQEAIDALKPYLPKKGASGRASAVVKYRDPANPENTWSGKGRPARWMQDYINAGKKKESFLVK